MPEAFFLKDMDDMTRRALSRDAKKPDEAVTPEQLDVGATLGEQSEHTNSLATKMATIPSSAQ